MTRRSHEQKPTVERIQKLAERITDGDILLPKFQRDFVWTGAQVLELLDSISRGYPIGSILLWLSKETLRSEKSIADLPIADRSEEYPVNYLLDGQQRLSAICGALYWEPTADNKDSIWNVVYDLRRRVFLHHRLSDEPPLHQIRLNMIPNASKFFQRQAALDTLGAPDVEELKDEAKRLFNTFVDYSIAAVTLEHMSIDDVAPIFERINSTGTKLTIVDLMRAATWSDDFDLVDTIDDGILAFLSEKGYGTLDRKVVLRVIGAAGRGGYAVENIDNLRKLGATELKVASVSAKTGLGAAVDFLQRDLSVPNADILPYANQVVVLADLFRKIPSPTAGQRAEIKRWFWRTTLGGYFSGWNTGQMSADVSLVNAFADGSRDKLDTAVTLPTSSIWETRSFRLNNALAKMLALLLASKAPRDLLTGQAMPLDTALAWQNKNEFHHLFPDALLRRGGVVQPQRNALANFTLLSAVSNRTIQDSTPSDYIERSKRALGQEFESVYDSNYIDLSGIAAMEQNNYGAFLKARALCLQRRAEELIHAPMTS